MRVDTRPRKRNAPRPAEKSCPQFLQWLRGRPCMIEGPGCDGKIQAAHVDYAGDKGMGTKASDRFTIPLCVRHHAWQHQHGWPHFERTWMGNRAQGASLRASNEYWRKWPGRLAWERKLEARNG